MSSYKRIEKIVSLINKDEKVLDVGTDHAMVPIMLFKNKITLNVDASEKNESPLLIAKNNLIKNKLDKNINLILSDGFEKIEPNNYDVIVIAGMGGRTIQNIILSKKFNGRYILNPNNYITELRLSIKKNKMKINNEIIIKERNIFNLILEVTNGKMKLNKKLAYLGPILSKNKEDVTLEYYEFLLKNHIENQIKSNNKKFNKKEVNWLQKALWKKVN